MAKTYTDRFGLVQWSTGSDSPARLDFNLAYANLEARAALDTGDTYAAMPVALLSKGRYALVGDGTYRALYRRNDANAWEQAVGNMLPSTLHFRAAGLTRTTSAVVISHPDHAQPGATIDYGGSALLTGTVRVWDTSDSTRGVVMIGTSLDADPVVRGRLHVRTRATGERGLVLQPYTPAEEDPGSGDLLVARTAGGSDTVRIDPLGRFRATPPAAFGGASLPTASVLAVSPTATPADGIENGLLLYGQESATSRSILRIQPDNTADLAPIMLVLRTGITLGRLPWGVPNTSSGTTTIAGNTVYVRGSGLTTTGQYFDVRRSDPTSPVTEANPALDTSLFRISSGGIGTSLPAFVSQRALLSASTMTLYRVTNFTGAFLDLARLVPDGLGGETAQLASTWASDGRLATGAWWKSVGTTRDARQSVVHYSRKWFALPSDGNSVGQNIDSGQTYTYTWAAMTVRSVTTTDLEIRVGLEFIILPSPTQPDTNSMLVETLISVNGGAYAVADSTHYTAPVEEVAARLGGDVFSTVHRMAALPAGATFTLRTRLTVGASVPDFRLRMIDVQAAEVILEQYNPPT